MTTKATRNGVVPRRPSAPIIEFLGATGTVTGSRFLVDGPRARVLVDCGLFQGLKELRQRNWRPFPVEPDGIEAVLLTHAHVDHSGFLPGLVRNGFAGPVFATHRSAELCEIVLPDCGHLQEEESRYANAKGFSKHSPALPLFTEDDAIACLQQLCSVGFSQRVEVAEGMHARFLRAGHILGSAIIELEIDGFGTIAFSGDLGRDIHPILRPPEAPPASDALLVESTYGDRRHGDEDAVELLREAIVRTADRGGMCVIPAFAVDRTEVILLHLKRLMDAGRLPRLPVYVDSPMALSALEVYRRAIADGDDEIRPELKESGLPFDSGLLVEAREREASIAIHEREGPGLIISASGMASGGRVLHHLARRLPDSRNSILIVGFQAAATRGRSLLDGARQLKLLGEYVPVHAEVIDLSSFSVHADGDELIAWLRRAPHAPRTTFVVHGEEHAASALRGRIESELDWNAVTPGFRERVLVARGKRPNEFRG